MKFCLISESDEIVIFKEPQSSIRLALNISQYDDGDSSKVDLEELDRLYIEKIGDRAATYFVDPRFNLEFWGQWDAEKKTARFKLAGETLGSLAELIGNQMQVHVEFKTAKVKISSEDKTKIGDKVLPGFTEVDVVLPSETQSATTKAMVVNTDSSLGPHLGFFCEDDVVEIPKELKSRMLNRGAENISFLGKIRVNISTCSFKYVLPSVRRRCLELHSLNKRILEELIFSDAIITGLNGTEIKCHRNFLAARSPVFAAMFRNDCKEKMTRRIQIEEMSDEGIKAFLAYIYFGGLIKPNEDSEIALELLEAGHKYEIKTLEQLTKQIFLTKPAEWMDVNVAFQLYFLAGRLTDCVDVKAKCIQVMKLKFEELKETEEYKELLFKDQKSAENLFE